MVKYAEILVFATVLVAAYAAPAEEECDKSKCEGPLKYYEELSCKPIYQKEGDCCAVAYNCDHLKTRSKDKCYYKGQEYKSEDWLKETLSDPCVGSCVCSVTNSDARFMCMTASCGLTEWMQPGMECYNPRSATECCPRNPVCVKPEDVPTCEVDGKIYKAGDLFVPAGEPNKRCYCNEGYKGENVAPFCRTLNEHCDTEIWHLHAIANNYPPIYPIANRKTSCPTGFRYPGENEHILKRDGTVVVADKEKSDTEDPYMKCKFGTLTLNRGEMLNSTVQWDGANVLCLCSVPPTLSCIEISIA